MENKVKLKLKDEICERTERIVYSSATLSVFLFILSDKFVK